MIESEPLLKGSNLLIRMNGGNRAYVDSMLSNGIPHHNALIYGDLRDELREFARLDEHSHRDQGLTPTERSREMKTFKLYINNQWVDAEGKKTFLSYNPSTNQPIAELASASCADVNAAVSAAKKAFKSWSSLSGDARADYMMKAADVMRRRLPELAKWEAQDTGKPIHETEPIDIPYAIRAMEYFAHQAREIQGQVIPLPNEPAFDWVTYEPYGVVGAITPWNFPLHIATRAICPAMAVGNTVVAKASTLSPITPIILGEIFEEVGLPPAWSTSSAAPGIPPARPSSTIPTWP